MLTRHQVYTILIVISAALMLGRIIAVNRTDMQEYQKYRFSEVNKRFDELEKQLRDSGNPSKETFADIEQRRQKALESEKRELPFFSANDRSRWTTIRALVEPDMRVQRTVKLPDGSEHTETVWYAIDKVQNLQGWNTIDMVKHNTVVDRADQSVFAIFQKDLTDFITSIPDIFTSLYNKIVALIRWDSTPKNELPPQPEGLRDGYLYSSKPTLLPTLMAIPYALIYWASDGQLSLANETHLIVRITVILCNLLPLVLSWFLLVRLIDRFGTTDWGRVFCVAFVCFGTFLSTFVITLNNHLPGVVSVTIALYCAVRIIYDKEKRWRYYILGGFFAAFAVACELPALLFFCLLGFWLLCHQFKRTLFLFLPAALLVAGAYFTTNYIAHKTFAPAYTKKYVENSWYLYDYERGGRILPSYWKSPAGNDAGEPKIEDYIFHSTVGKYGLFSLTPVWVLSFLGLACWLFDRRYRSLSAIILLTSVVVFAFYMQQPLHERNYGGNTSALRWMFWFAPLWSLALVAAADWFSRTVFLRVIALLCLVVSIMSAAYPIWNPWTMPWTHNLLQYLW